MNKKILFILPVLLISFVYAQGQPSVLILAAENDTSPNLWAQDVQNKLSATGEFAFVDHWAAQDSTPTTLDLNAYDVVFTWSDFEYFEPDILGDNLAEYIEGGGHVVNCVFSLNNGLSLGGAFAVDYQLIEPASITTGQQTLGTITSANHPTVYQLSSFDGGTSSYRSNSTNVSGTVAAEWSDGLPLIVYDENVGPANSKRVDLNFWPVSSDGAPSSGGWVSTTDGVLIMTNAILWVADAFNKVVDGDFVNENFGSYTALSGDYDNDGYPDLFVPNYSGTNRLYKNNGDGTFASVVAGDLGADTNASFGGSWGDFDNDGDLDLFVANGGFSAQNNSLYENNGDGTFTSIVAGDLGLDNVGSMSGAWADYDLDGDLDIAVANHNSLIPNYLYINNGDGTFTQDASFFTADLGSSWAMSWGDYNGDMYPELYVSNQSGVNFLYQNNAGVFAKITSGDPVLDNATTFGSTWVDYDGDLDLDLFVPSNAGNNFLYINDGAGNFTKDLTNTIVTEPGDTWSASWGDYDNDGDVDLYLGQEFSSSVLFENTGLGNFIRKNSTFVSRDNKGTLGSTWIDIDLDGDLDLYGSNFNATNNFYENTGNGNNWIGIDLQGTASNAQGIGSKIWVEYGSGSSSHFEVNTHSGRGQMTRVHAGLGSSTVKSVNVQWPSGAFQSAKVANNQNILIEELVPSTNRPDVLLVASDQSTNTFDVQRKLIACGKFEIVQNFSAQSATPSVTTLSDYDVVMVWSNFGFNDPIALGNNLADYIDQGGRVVVATFATLSGFEIQGRYATDYRLLTPGSIVTGQAALGSLLIPNHPILDGVATFDGGTSSYRSSVNVSDGTVIAQWDDGLPLLVAKDNAAGVGARIVEMNFWPVSEDAFSGNWVTSTDGGLIMQNALQWVMSEPDQFTKITSGDVVNDIGFSWGLSWGDMDNNVHLDLLVGNDGNDFLYQNNGNGTFSTNLTDEIVLEGLKYSVSSAWGDFDNDGFQDVFIADRNGTGELYRNNGDGTLSLWQQFTDAISNTGSAWGDFNNDGYLDLFVASEGDPNLLYENNTDGSFTLVTSGEIVTESFITYGCIWGDYNDDGNLDIYVVNSSGPNSLFRNEGDGTFTKITDGPTSPDQTFSVTASWGDYDNDADLDLFVGNYGGENNKLYQNNGDGTFTSIVGQNLVTYSSYAISSSWEDFDNDGYLDLFVSQDGEHDKLFQNNGDGTFKEITSWAPVLGEAASYGSGWADYNEDGYPDLAVVDFNGSSSTMLYENNGGSNNWINIKLQGTISNLSAVGAKVYVTANGTTQMREVTSQSGFSSQSSINVEFGLGTASIIDDILINWPSGTDQFLYDVGVNQFLTIEEDGIEPTVDSEDFPTFFDKNGGEQLASITVSDDQGIDFVNVAYVGVTESVDDIAVVAAETTDGITFTFDLATIDNIGDPLGIEYLFAVNDLAGNTAFSSNGTTHIEYLGNTSPTIPNLKFGSNETDYQMISIPLEVNNNSVSSIFGDDLGGVDDREWRLFHFENGNTNELNGSTTIDVDEGYWLIVRSSSTIDVGEGSVPQVTEGNPFQMSLSSGWNQIGNPYNFTISWQEVLDFNGNPSAVDTELVVYNGGFSATDLLTRFRGAFVFTSSDITLDIPVLRNKSLPGGRKGEHQENPIDSENWSVDLMLNSGDFNYSLGGIGMNKEANLTKDKFDRLTVPKFIKHLEINFDNLEYEANRFTKSVVPSAENSTWKFTVDSNIENEKVTMSWDNSYWGDSDKQLILFDKVSQKSINMRQNTSYTFNYYGPRQFETYFGGSEFIDDKLTPKTIEISKAHPNPFIDQSSILLAIPDGNSYTATLTVYNQLGAMIKVITLEGLDAGYHELSWDGSSDQGVKASSGIYFGRIDVMSNQQNLRITQRLILE